MILAAAPDGRAEATDPLPEALRLSDIVTIAVVTPDVGFEDAAMRDKFEAEFQLRLEKKGYRVVLALGTPALRSAFETTLREIASPPLIGRTGGWRLPQTSFQSLADESSADALLVSRVRRHAPGAELENESTACMFPVVVPVVACPIPCVFPRVETTTTDLSVALVEVRTGLIVWMSERSESYGGIRGMASRLVRELPPQRVFVPAPVVE